MTALFNEGYSIRAIARALGHNRETVGKYAKKLQPERCECGKPNRHKGWCVARMVKGEVRRDVADKVCADFKEPPPPSKPVRTEIRASYPYCGAGQDRAHLLQIDKLVPRSISDDMRADICQEIALALLEGRVTLEQLRRRSRDVVFFIKTFYRDNFEQAGHAILLGGLYDNRSYDEIASSIAARDWHEGEMNERRRARDSLLSKFHPPTQIEDVFNRQVERRKIELHRLALETHDSSLLLSSEEVASMLADEGTEPTAGELDADA